MTAHSAGLLAHRVDDGELLVFVAHMGGPFWARKDAGAWSIPKGLFDPATESAPAAARREFAEEIGVPAPEGEPVPLGDLRVSGGKVVTAFAVEAPASLAFRASNTFETEWPPRSGRTATFPEVDRAAWMTLAQAREKLVKGQRPLLDRLVEALGAPATGDPHPGTA